MSEKENKTIWWMPKGLSYTNADSKNLDDFLNRLSGGGGYCEGYPVELSNIRQHLKMINGQLFENDNEVAQRIQEIFSESGIHSSITENYEEVFFKGMPGSGDEELSRTDHDFDLLFRNGIIPVDYHYIAADQYEELIETASKNFEKIAKNVIPKLKQLSHEIQDKKLQRKKGKVMIATCVHDKNSWVGDDIIEFLILLVNGHSIDDVEAIFKQTDRYGKSSCVFF